MTGMIWAFVLLIFAALVWVAPRLAAQQDHDHRLVDTWRQLAEQRGLTLHPGPMLRGRVHGCALELRQQLSVGQGTASQTVCAVRQLPPHLELDRPTEGVLLMRGTLLVFVPGAHDDPAVLGQLLDTAERLTAQLVRAETLPTGLVGLVGGGEISPARTGRGT